MTTPLGPLNNPDLVDLLLSQQQLISSLVNCHQIGKIVSFDASLQTAVVQIGVLRQIPDVTRDPPTYITKAYPLLVDCPVYVPTGGTGRLTFPIEPGDTCLVLFNDRDLDIWFTTGNTQAPNSGRLHDLSDGLVLVGFRNKANKISNYSTTDVELRYKGGVLKINDKISLDGNAMTLKQLLTDIKAALTALDAKTGPSAAAAIAVVQADITALLQ